MYINMSSRKRRSSCRRKKSRKSSCSPCEKPKPCKKSRKSPCSPCEKPRSRRRRCRKERKPCQSKCVTRDGERTTYFTKKFMCHLTGDQKGDGERGTRFDDAPCVEVYQRTKAGDETAENFKKFVMSLKDCTRAYVVPDDESKTGFIVLHIKNDKENTVYYINNGVYRFTLPKTEVASGRLVFEGPSVHHMTTNTRVYLLTHGMSMSVAEFQEK